MKINDIIFDENLEMNFLSEKLNKKVRLSLLDDLSASEEVLTDSYRKKISDFINDLPIWYAKAIEAVKVRGKNKYNLVVKDEDIQLMAIFILFEQTEDALFGLNFRVEFDIEHGCGLKIKGEGYEIIDIGTADIAFS